MKKFLLLQIPWSLLCVLVGVVIGFVLPHPTSLPQETPEEILVRLNEAGLEYEGRWINGDVGIHHGFHVKPKSDTRPWSMLANIDDLPGSSRHVVFVPVKGHVDSHPIIGDYYLIGDHDEIERIVAALGQ